MGLFAKIEAAGSAAKRYLTQKMVCDIGGQGGRAQKRVLVCYLDYAKTKQAVEQGANHTNKREYLQIIEVLAAHGYAVDACDCRYRFHPADKIAGRYNLLFGFGPAFFAAKALNPAAYNILYMTESPYDYSLRKEQERVDYYRQRHGVQCALQRTGVYYRPNDEKKCAAVLCVGDTACFSPGTAPLRRIGLSAMRNPDFTIADAAQRESKSFLVLGSLGLIHKGNDLVLEAAAAHPDWTVYYCGTGLAQQLKRIGAVCPPNVTDMGFVGIDTPEFVALAKKCGAILLFSCSEGMPTSVLTGMRHGMIPIVCHGCGLDELSDYCLFASSFRLPDIEAAMAHYATMPQSERTARSRRIYDYANAHFTPETFRAGFDAALTELLNATQSKINDGKKGSV